MSEVYGKSYFDHYDIGNKQVNYADSAEIQNFLTGVAEQIVKDLHPKTVLDAGCAMGYLVAALRDRGVEAYGMDCSEYAISMVREDVRPFCAVGSLTEELPESLPKRYDLVVTIEVLEHLSAEEGKKAIAKLCALSDTILFASSPDVSAEQTHVNVQQREYWARLFAENGFADNLSYRPTYITSSAVCYRRNGDTLSQVEDYERNIRLTEAAHQKELAGWSKAVEDKERQIQNQNSIIEQLQRQAEERSGLQAELERLSAEQKSLRSAQDRTKAELASYRKRYFEVFAQREEMRQRLAEAEQAYSIISNAAAWKMTKPLRVAMDAAKRMPALKLTIKGVKSLKNEGIAETWRKVRDKSSRSGQNAKLARQDLFTEEELEQQREHTFPREIKFSIVVPLYNTPERFLREMIQSVLNQTYGNWELCMADGSDSEHRDVEQVCLSYAKKDSRIRYQKLDKNYGISGNTNACLEMAQGDYIGLFDHDDLLHPAALHEVMKAICEKDADFIYTDENTFHKTPADAFVPHFKPAYAPDTLRANNYICHFTVFQRDLLEKTGGFRSECDGSQDYDMVLRLTEQAQHIVHIPEILYYWRAHENSVAESVGAKPYVIEAAHKAIADHLTRVGLEGEVLDTVVPSIYRIKYAIKGEPLVSILIPSYEHEEDLRRCIESIEELSTYRNYEIVVIENNSKKPETFQFYDEIQKRWNNVKVIRWEGVFNYSAINNFGAQHCAGEYLLLLNNDTEVISPDWMQEMLMFAQRPDVGAVGAKLYYPDDTIQHGGVGIGLLTLAGHLHRGFPRQHPGYMGRLIYAHNLSAVTAACVLIRRDVWESVNGLDESFAVAFNDVDLCMRIRKAGYRIVWTPFAELYHYESKSRGLEDTPEKRERFQGEVLRFQERWRKELAAGDPYYSPNLTLDREDFSLEPVVKQHEGREG